VQDNLSHKPTGRGLLFGVAFTLLLSGCAAHRGHQPELNEADGLKVAQPPLFLSGPAALLLTNADDYTAQLTVSQTNGLAEPLTGKLFQKEGQLLFVPSTDSPTSRGGWGGSFRFLCNAKEGGGLVISERLRGFATWTAPAQYRGVSQAGPVTIDQVDNQPCVVQSFTVTAGDSRPVEARVWRTEGGAGPPARITCAESEAGSALIVQLTDLNPDPLSPELFEPPAGAVKFESAAAMVRELMRKAPVLPYSHTESSGGRRRR
jgi:hypothetical protein